MGLHSTAAVEAMLKATGGVPVAFGGVRTWGHFEHVPTEVGDQVSVVASDPSVVIASESLPEVGLCNAAGSVRGIGRSIEVGSEVWVIRGIETGESDGEIRLLLANR